jgi:Meckel syndrome type 1 protein
MFDISALLSLKPTGPVLDQGPVAGPEALQTNPFSQILSTQLESQPAAPDAAAQVVPELAALAIAADPAGKLQPGGNILPDALPGTLPLTADTPVADSETAETPQVNRLDKILANRVEVQTPVKKVAEGKPTKRPSREHAKAETVDPAETVSTAETPQPLPGQILAAQVEALPTIPVAPQPEVRPDVRIPAETAQKPASTPIAKGAVPQPTVVATAPTPPSPVAFTPNIAAQQPAVAAEMPIALSTATLAAISLPQFVAAKDLPASTTIPATASTIALVAAQNADADAKPAPITAPVPATAQVVDTEAKPVAPPQQTAAAVVTVQPAIDVAAPVVQLAPLPTVPAMPPVVAAAAAPDLGAEAVQQVAIDSSPKTTISAKVQAPRASVARKAESSAVASPAKPAAKESSPTNAERTVAAPAPQSAGILTDLRQPVVGPAAVSATPAAPAEAPQDFAALVDRLIAARETAGPRPVQATISHAEFGRVSLDFRQDGGDLSVAMKSADAGFAPAVLAALATDKHTMPTDSQQPSQSQVQAVAQTQAQAQMNMGAQTQSQSQSQPQQQSQSQQAGGGSAQFHQDTSGQRGGEGAQGRGSQERNTRYQSNSKPAGRDNGSSQPRNGTYA